jgi:5-methylcytosine-specific restriction endonuclease McrBC regulatory subunit McrC
MVIGQSQFQFDDSTPEQPWGGQSWEPERKALPRLCCAIEKLNEAARSGKVQIITISGKRRVRPELPEIITYRVTKRSTIRSWDTIADAVFNVSHYIGTYSTKIAGEHGNDVVTIKIEPRWGKRILQYLLQYTTGIYMPPDAASGIQAAPHSAEWILVLLWRSLFNQALRRFHIPKEYQIKRTNDRFFKGRLDVPRQIHENIADQSKFCCVHAPLTLDTTINRTIRYIYRLLARRLDYGVLLKDIATYDERLAAFGVKETDVRLAEIDRIRYTRMSEGYRPLMQISRAIIRRFGATASHAVAGETSFFIDVAEVWENYLQAILTRHLPARYRVISPNEIGGQWLVSGERREIRPDLIIERDGIPAAIVDAKFKRYRAIGKFEKDGISREDLYQMATYLYHYGERDFPLLGLFISPEKGAGDLQPLENRQNHAIGVLNFDLAHWDDGSFDINAIKAYEGEFADTLERLLEESAAGKLST